ncbi:MAG: DNA polymerase III subunit alpha, partial [Chloroflexota bacterium]
MTFTHLEVHSHYTLLGATASIEELVARAQADEMTCLALTDTNALYGAVAFDKACRPAGIRPILGLTLSVARPPDDMGTSVGDHPGQLVLLATGPAGYRSLCGLSSLIQGRPDREAKASQGLNWDELGQYADGLICLSGGKRGWLYRYIQARDLAAASRYLAKLGGIYGQNLTLSLEIHQENDQTIAQEIVNLGQRFGLPPVAVQPVYYLEPADSASLRLLKAIDRNCPVEEVTDDLEDLGWLSPGEVSQRLASFPEALDQVGRIADRCQPALPDSSRIWPTLDLPAGQTPDQALAELAREGLLARYGPTIPDQVSRRLEVELRAITESGYAPLFLIVADIVRYARQQEVPVSTRGSVANSLVAYCTGITTVDPIENDLLFERFLNPARSNPPDIDLDFCSRRRDEVLAYVRQTYGEDRVALVATISTLRPKSAVREAGKAHGLADGEIGHIARRLPREWHPDPRRRSKRTMLDLAEEVEDAVQRRLILAANDIVGQPHHLSIHPGGLVITPGPLTDYVPVQWAPKGFLITQFDHQDLEALGLPKLDLLGIRALTVLADTADLVRLHHDPSFRLDQIPLDDQQTGDLLADGDTIGVFQCESAGARRTLRQLQVRTVFDLAVANAFFKPGPATGGMATSFIRRYRGQEIVSYLHPALEPILASTKGVLLFQEQILRVATEIAGLSWAQADHLRRGMSKFQAQEMAAMQTQFVQGCCRPEPEGPAFSPEQAQTLWEQVLAFAGYGFNRGHATAYADVSYRSAYLKTHWPAAFLNARLADWGGFHHPAIYMAEARRLSIPIRPPHVNFSHNSFTLTYNLQPSLWAWARFVTCAGAASGPSLPNGRSNPFSLCKTWWRGSLFKQKNCPISSGAGR